MKNFQYSKDFKELMSVSREIAIELGYDRISTIHFFLADCQMNNNLSIRNFVFRTTSEYETFFKSHRIGESTIFAESLPITREAEKSIRKANLKSKQYGESEVQPYHLFLAAVENKKTLFYLTLNPKKDLDKKKDQNSKDVRL